MRLALALLALVLLASTAAAQERIDIPLASDTLLVVTNTGASRILVSLNDSPTFKLATDPEEVMRSSNAFHIPAFGSTTLDVSDLFLAEGNVAFVLAQGPTGIEDPVVAFQNTLNAGQPVVYEVSALDPLPPQPSLLRNAPNPFRESTTVTVAVPEARITGVRAKLTVHDARGRLLATLREGTFFPGRFDVPWHTRGRFPAGLYFFHLQLESETYTVSATLVP